MSEYYKIEYNVTLRGGVAVVAAESHDEALAAFYTGEEPIRKTKAPYPETTVKSVTKLKE